LFRFEGLLRVLTFEIVKIGHAIAPVNRTVLPVGTQSGERSDGYLSARTRDAR